MNESSQSIHSCFIQMFFFESTLCVNFFSEPLFVDQDGLRVDFQPNGVDFQNGGDFLPREAEAEGAEGEEGDLPAGGGEMDRTCPPSEC